MSVSLADAKRMIEAGEKKAGALGQPMNIAVADAGGNLVAHVRMDGSWIGSIDISQKKAYTSRAFDIATKDLAEHSQSGNQFFGIHASNGGKIMIFAGGVPLKRNGAGRRCGWRERRIWRTGPRCCRGRGRGVLSRPSTCPPLVNRTEGGPWGSGYRRSPRSSVRFADRFSRGGDIGQAPTRKNTP